MKKARRKIKNCHSAKVYSISLVASIQNKNIDMDFGSVPLSPIQIVRFALVLRYHFIWRKVLCLFLHFFLLVSDFLRCSISRFGDAELCGNVDAFKLMVRNVWRCCSLSKPIDQITRDGKSDKRKIGKCVSLRICTPFDSSAHTDMAEVGRGQSDEDVNCVGHGGVKGNSNENEWMTDIKNTSRTIRYI